MAERDHIPLGVSFYPDWFNKHYGVSFDRQYYFDPETRIEAKMEIDKRLYERFGDVGLGDKDSKPKPLITFGMVMLPAIFGCEIVFQSDALPWAMPLKLSEDKVMKLEVPDIFNASPMTDMIKQMEYLKDKYDNVVGDINVTGVQNLALKIRGEQLYIDYFENPELCHHLLKICTESIIQLFQYVYKITGTGAIDVTPMCDPGLFVIPNCTVEQISLETYEKYVLDYDNQVADACHPLGVHHCGSVNQVLDGYAKIRYLEFIEIGFGSDVKRGREVFGPKVAVNSRINPVLMKTGTTEEVAAEVRSLIDQGAPLHNFSIDTVGLTYGTPDENIRAARETAAEYGKIPSFGPAEAESRPSYSFGKPAKLMETTVTSATQTVVIGPRQPLVIIGERINPTGRKKLAQALEKGNLDLVQSEAIKQVEEGAHILDVNVGVSGIDEPRMLKEAILAIREVTDVPLCIDSALPKALEGGLEVYEGKALVNSVNGEELKLKQVLPLVKKHGAAVIGLTMDDRGIPREAETRLEIAGKIVERAEQMGIPREDVIIDPLAMAVSADYQAGLETIKALQLIRDELGVNQTLGLSNISFGLPERASINAVFLAMAMLSGLTCPIVDPTVWEMRKALLVSDMLLGKDEYCMNYISISGKGSLIGRKVEPTAKGEEVVGEGLEAIKASVISGKRKNAAALTQKALDSGADPQGLIDNTLIPALNTVGEKFEQRKIFIPEMMMSAKSMQACVDLIKPLLKKQSEGLLGTVVLGTVFGDLHDIGKNLVKLLLETSGFKVINLGEIKSSDVSDRVKVICGGAAMTLKFVKACGADAYAKDAAEGVKLTKELLGVSA
jgi:methanogenic corrinoid protein MtbC1/uroporphyrinogen-III decarboxylase